MTPVIDVHTPQATGGPYEAPIALHVRGRTRGSRRTVRASQAMTAVSVPR